MEQNLASRLKEYIDSTEYNNSQFADICGIPRPSLSQILTGRNKKVSNQILEQIHSAFPDLSIMWLIFGEGPMQEEKRIFGISDPQSSFSANRNADQPQSSFSNPPSSEVGLDFAPASENENLKNTYSPSRSANQSTPEGLIMPVNDPLQVEYKQIEAENKIRDLQVQIEKMQLQIDKIKENPRKVLQITVYYDDSTFETFIPGK